MTELILHHYDASPFTQRALRMLGIKDLNWYSVETPMMPPKPDLVALTGGYRGTPVLQIGAEVFVDSQRIAMELDHRFPENPLIPADQAGLALALVKWCDVFFRSALTQILAASSDSWDPTFLEDRKYLFHDIDFDRAGEEAAHAAAQFRAHCQMLEKQLAHGRPFLTGDRPTLMDVQAWPVTWMGRGGLPDMAHWVESCAHLAAWEQRMADVGEGTRTVLSADEALDRALHSQPGAVASVDEADPLGLRAGQPVRVEPDDTRRGGVEGELLICQPDRVAVRRQGDRVGTVVVHFPRMGYRVVPLNGMPP